MSRQLCLPLASAFKKFYTRDPIINIFTFRHLLVIQGSTWKTSRLLSLQVKLQKPHNTSNLQLFDVWGTTKHLQSCGLIATTEFSLCMRLLFQVWLFTLCVQSFIHSLQTFMQSPVLLLSSYLMQSLVFHTNAVYLFNINQVDELQQCNTVTDLEES